MEQREHEAIQSLIEHDFELRRQYREHTELEKQIKSFNGRVSLPSAAEAERKRLQKRKLAGMDRMMAILASYREKQAAPGR